MKHNNKKLLKWPVYIFFIIFFMSPTLLLAIGIPGALIALDFIMVSQTKQWLKSPKIWVTAKKVNPFSDERGDGYEIIYEYYDSTGILKECQILHEDKVEEGQQKQMILWTKKNGTVSLINPSDLNGNLNDKGNASHNWILLGFAVLFGALGWLIIGGIL